ncbi:ATP-binding cassette domain-containing protein [Cohnella sp. CFH 77786]|nr:ABC transporter transmembrane domain-containing protein [Cohnella sp. CFH 77786]MBW5448789.1 ATP-binding cassette domain-containing protein [Cohnella sp. CFH 77786]
MVLLQKMAWFFKLRWIHYAAAILLIVLEYSINMLPPKLIGNVIDAIKEGELTGPWLHSRVLTLFGIAVLAYVMIVGWVNLMFRNAILIERMLRSKLLEHLTKMSPSFFQRFSRGDLMAQATNDIRAVNFAAGYGIMTFVHTVIGALLVVTMMAVFVDVKLMLASLLPMPVLAFFIRVLGNMVRVRFLAAQEAFGKLNDQALESISGLRVIRSYGQEKHDVEAFRQVAEATRRKNARVAVIHASFQPTISILVGMSFSIGIGYGSYLVSEGEIELGDLVAFMIYLGMLIWPMIAFGEFINVMQRGGASAGRIHETLVQKSEIVEADHPVEGIDPDRIEFRRLTFRYPEASGDSLTGISIVLEKGQTLGIVGRTGSGKTTLLKQLLRQYPIQPHSLLVGGVPIEEIAVDQIKRWVGYVPQEHLLLSKTISENIRLGRIDAYPEEVERAADSASLTFDIAQMKDGMDTLIGENGLMLSGGQKQRIGIARALLIDPEILILDDALSAVDARTESAILHNIRQVRKGKTTMIATHRMSAVSHADWIIVLEDGRIVEEGTHDHLMFRGGWYREQYERQQIEASLLQQEG